MSSESQVADGVSIRENKLSLVERLADDLAHEIKNPLHSMVINLEVLRRRLARLETESREELLRYAGVLAAELERVNRRVDLLLRVVRPNPESDELVTFAEILDELQELVELECERHQVRLVIDIPALSIRARLPKATTRQLILSLVLKTLDSVPSGGTLTIGAEESAGCLRIRLAGVDAEGNPAIPLDAARDDESYLLVARALAQSLGGGIEVVNDYGVGNGGPRNRFRRFVLSLPSGV